MIILIEECWNQDSGLRPDFKEIISRLERLKIEDAPSTQNSSFEISTNNTKLDLIECVPLVKAALDSYSSYHSELWAKQE